MAKLFLGLFAFQVLGSSAQLTLLPSVSTLIPAPPITPAGTYTSYQIGPLCKPSGAIKSPTTEAQVKSIVRSAIAANKKVKAFGQRHSMSDIICTDGVAIDMSSFKGMRLNADNTVTAGSGVQLRELGLFLHKNGRALQVTPAYGGITIGGAIGTGAHGSSLKHESSLSGQTVGMRIIDGTGTARNINSPGDLKSFRVHLGMIGVVLEATILTVPDFKMTVHNYKASDAILTNGEWEKMARAGDSFILYWFPSVNKVVISNGTFVSIDTPGDCYSNDHVPPTSDTFNALAVPAVEVIQTLGSDVGMYLVERYLQETLTIQTPGFVPIYTEDGLILQNPGTGYPYKMMDAICGTNCDWLHYPNNVTLLDNEISMDVKDMAAFITTVKDILSKTPAYFILQGILLRFSRGTDTYMSTANGRDTVHFEWYPVKRKNPYKNAILGDTAYQVMMQAMAMTYGGRSHWGKSGFYYHSRDMIQRKLNQTSRAAFIAQMEETDPNQIFMNAFGRRLLNTSDVMNTDPLTTHCAILDNCACKVHTDCANGRVCGTIIGYSNFKACKTPGLTQFPDLSGLVKPFTNLLDFLKCLGGLTPLACLLPVTSILPPLMG